MATRGSLLEPWWVLDALVGDPLSLFMVAPHLAGVQVANPLPQQKLKGELMAAVEISDSVQQGLDAFFGFLPNLLAFLVILAVGFLYAWQRGALEWD